MAAQLNWSLTYFPRVVSCGNKVNEKPVMRGLCSHLNDQHSMLCPSSDTRNTRARAHSTASVPLVFAPRPVLCLCSSPFVGSPLSSSPNLTPSSKCKVLPGPLILYCSLSQPSFCAGQGKALNEGVGVSSADFWPLETILIATISEMRGATDL